MSFQAYLSSIEVKTVQSPKDLIQLAGEKRLDVGSSGFHMDESTTLRLDGVDSR